MKKKLLLISLVVALLVMIAVTILVTASPIALTFAIIGAALFAVLLTVVIARSPPVASSAKAFGGNAAVYSCQSGRIETRTMHNVLSLSPLYG